ncbi:hypothetical protein CEXT_401471 [Caerostris extrusa]|uniref:Prolactin receptor n=1 Tax=Caerostris extrusa TaxID=172846 RepID=A0AAV4NLZ7_CAEEX|nr:hypothetical protein CEXT_401471 [Caerostris extrusa]
MQNPTTKLHVPLSIKSNCSSPNPQVPPKQSPKKVSTRDGRWGQGSPHPKCPRHPTDPLSVSADDRWGSREFSVFPIMKREADGGAIE